MKTKRGLRHIYASGALALAGAGVCLNSHADVVTMNATNVFLASGSPTTGSSAVTATFTDASAGEVDLNVSFTGVVPSFYNVNTVWLNLASSVASTFNNTLSFTLLNKSAGLNTPAVNQFSTPYKTQADDAGYYSIAINTFNNTFVSGDSISFKITSSQAGLLAADFIQRSSSTQDTYTGGSSPDGNYDVAAQIFGGDSGPTQVYFVGALTATDVPNVPDTANTLLPFGFGFACMAMAARAPRLKPARI